MSKSVAMKMFLSLPLLFFVLIAHTQNAIPQLGTWNGSLDIQGMTLRLVLHLSQEDQQVVAKMDSPDQGAFGIPASSASINGDTVSVEFSNLRAAIKGVFNAESNHIDATFTQAGMSFPLLLKREEIAAPEYNRPQEPTSFPYKVEEVKFENPVGGHRLAGTLTMPSSGTVEKVVVLVSGSGPQDRNEELLKHKPFLVLSDFLTREGIAVLRYDDRGVGESEGDFSLATSADFATDAEAALAYLDSREEFKTSKKGIIGHSEGGMIAPIVASRTDVDFIVLLAGPGTPLDELLKAQSMLIGKATGESEDGLEFNINLLDKVILLLKENQSAGNEEIREMLEQNIKDELNLLPEEELEQIGDLEAFVQGMVGNMGNNWFRYFIVFQPENYLKKVSCPVLAVNGSKDLQVPSRENLTAIGKALLAGGNLNFTLQEFEGLNHLFQECETGSPAEYIVIEETFNEKALEYISDWIHQLYE